MASSTSSRGKRAPKSCVVRPPDMRDASFFQSKVNGQHFHFSECDFEDLTAMEDEGTFFEDSSNTFLADCNPYDIYRSTLQDPSC
ncbi:hypothetical protein RIF29_20586 [Crotalaria pallida]|uniref:Uncharacterized protein n=1 Tax=Crotalaria pallida TaxID=3830 RepID=A0AAN9F3U9_CROPI